VRCALTRISRARALQEASAHSGADGSSQAVQVNRVADINDKTSLAEVSGINVPRRRVLDRRR
jgi:hypothetical protein